MAALSDFYLCQRCTNQFPARHKVAETALAASSPPTIAPKTASSGRCPKRNIQITWYARHSIMTLHPFRTGITGKPLLNGGGAVCLGFYASPQWADCP